MAKRKTKRFGKLGYSADDAGSIAEQLRKNATLVEKVAARRKAKGQKPDTNSYIHVPGMGGDE